MRRVWCVADSVISPLGLTSKDNYSQVTAGVSSSKQERNPHFGNTPVCISHLSGLSTPSGATRFEAMSRMALQELKRKASIPQSRTLFILSTTKGNIEVLENGQPGHPRIHLHDVARMLAAEMGVENHRVISNACISGVAAILLAKRYLENGVVDHVLVLGADTLNRFVISGFQSLNALSANPCKPFDSGRSGINLGEAAAALLLSAKPEEFETASTIAIRGGSISNDANHISGPSKTGEELAMAVKIALEASGIGADEIDFISAHGTATLYNDEMEAKAFHLSKLGDKPIHSLKGNFGHTLGAAGVVETVMCVHSLLHQELMPSYGFEKIGVSQPVNVIKKRTPKSMRFGLKTASGFGGCNAALVLSVEK